MDKEIERKVALKVKAEAIRRRITPAISLRTTVKNKAGALSPAQVEFYLGDNMESVLKSFEQNYGLSSTAPLLLRSNLIRFLYYFLFN